MIRPTFDAAIGHLSLAATALSDLTDETRRDPRVVRTARMIDAVVGQGMAKLAAAQASGQHADLAVASVCGAVRVISIHVPALHAMPETRACRASVDMLAEAFAPFTRS